jgi:hypothetical protein
MDCEMSGKEGGRAGGKEGKRWNHERRREEQVGVNK